MASSSSSYSQKGKNPGLSGIVPSGRARKVSESTRLYDVFINHRGPDSKHTLALPLYESLEALGIRTFLDIEEMELGVSCISTIETAISSAAVHIAIFSKRYAESPWCLEELVLMINSQAKIIPVFYEVEPSELRYIKGAYADAFNQYQNKYRHLKKLDEWKKALRSISYIHGHQIKNFNDREGIVSAVQEEVQRTKLLPVHDFERRCLDKLVQDFEIQCGMNGGEGKAKIVGIYGIGGVGKTTLCKELFNRKRQQYNRACFLFDCREASAQSKLPSLQMKILRDLFGEKDLSFLSTEEGLSSISNCIERSSSSSFLIVLDDIDHQDQLDALPVTHMTGNSLVIITTRDEGVLIAEGIEVRYHLKEMDKKDARKLFSLHAFSHSHPASGYEDLVDDFLGVCGGLPLSLQVLGRHVRGRNDNYWRSELKKFSRKLHPDIKKVLKISFDALDDEEKQIFIDIACFFVDELQCIAERVWEASGWSGLQTLKDKCLIETDGRPFHLMLNGTDDIEDRRPVLRMHEHLRELGREMANEPSYPRRLWRPQELENLESKGFQNILAQTRGRCFHSFFDESLKSRITFFLGESDDSAATSTSLLWLQLDVDRYSSDSIPSWIPLQNMQCFRIYNGHFKRLWQQDVQSPSQLRELEISGTSLEEFPDFLGILTNVGKEVVEGQHMAAIEGSFPTNLHVSELNDGRKSATIKAPLSFLEDLVISEQENIVKIVISGNHCPKLQSLELFSLQNIIEVKFSNCEDLERLNCPKVRNSKDLKRLSVTSNLSKLEEPRLGCLGYLKRITIADCNLKSVPGICGLRTLVELNISGCSMLHELSLPQLGCLEKVTIENCSNLESVTGISDLLKLVELSISWCRKLQLGLRLVGFNFLERITVDSSVKFECFELERCKNLERVSGTKINFHKIRMVNISDCPELREFPFPVICGASCLERITINGCMKLNHLELTDCRILKRLSGNFDLDELSIDHCPMLEELPCFGHVTRLEEIHILRCGNLQNISLPRTLKCLELNGCGELKSLSGISALKELVELNIRACPKLHELGVAHLSWLEKLAIANLKKVSGISNLTNLVELEISKCWELELELCLSGMNFLKTIAIIESGKMHTITLPTSLTNLTLEACRELEKVAGISALTELLELKIKNSRKLQVDLHLSKSNCLYTISVVENQNMHNMTLPVTLRELRVQKCRNLQRIAGFEDLTELTELYISECPELEEIPSLARASHFERIKIDSCDKLQNITLPTKLVKFTVQSCRHLQRIAGMVELTELYVRECSELEELPSLAGVSWMESINIDSSDKLHNITLSATFNKLIVERCRGLQRIAGMSDFKDVTELCIRDCPELEQSPFICGSSSLERITIDGCRKLEELPCFGHLTCLEEIRIFRCRKLQEVTLPTTLKLLHLDACTELIKVSEISHLNNLVQLIISQCWQLELPLRLESINSLESITFDGCGKLQSFELNKCQNLKRVSGNFDVERLSIFDCAELEELSVCCWDMIYIESCDKLENITLPTTLIKLKVHRCRGLQMVVGIGNQTKLKDISISECPMLEVPSLAVLSCLESINIHSCERLHNITLPTTLIKLSVHRCRSLQMVVGIGNLTKITDMSIRECPELEELPSLAGQSCLESINIDSCWSLHNITLPTTLIKLSVHRCRSLQMVVGIGNLTKLTDMSIRECPELEELPSLAGQSCLESINIDSCWSLHNITLPTTLIKLSVHRCGGLQMVVGIGKKTKLKDISISDCPQLKELPSLAVLSCLESINIVSCWSLHNITLPTTLIKLSVHRCGGLQMVVGIGNQTKLRDMFISECPKLEELPSLAGLSCLESINIDSCERLYNITLPTTLIKLRVQQCRKLQRVAGIDYPIKLECLDISVCPELEELPSLARLSCLKNISIDSCEKLETIAGIEELQALETLQLLFCGNAAIQNCIGKLKRVPSAFIQEIGKAAEGAKSNLNPSLLSEAIFCEDEATLYRTLDDLEGSVSAIIVCGVVDGSSSAILRSSALEGSVSAIIINKQFNLPQGEWIITAVITDIKNTRNYFWQFDNLIKQGMMKGCTWAVKKGQDLRTLHALTTIIDKLHQK